MSYDLYLIKTDPGQDPLEAARAQYELEDDDPIQPTPAQKQDMHRLAQVLLSRFPELTNDFEDDQEIEISGPEDSGVTMELYGHEVAVSIAYWHSGDRAAAVMEQVRRYLAVLQHEAGYVVYDPQQDGILDLSSDLGSAQQVFDDVAAKLPHIIAQVPERHNEDLP